MFCRGLWGTVVQRRKDRGILFSSPPAPPPPASHLRGNVVWSAAEGLGGDPVPDILFAHAEIGNLDVPFRVQHHVVEFQVPAAFKTDPSHKSVAKGNLPQTLFVWTLPSKEAASSAEPGRVNPDPHVNRATPDQDRDPTLLVSVS